LGCLWPSEQTPWISIDSQHQFEKLLAPTSLESGETVVIGVYEKLFEQGRLLTLLITMDLIGRKPEDSHSTVNSACERQTAVFCSKRKNRWCWKLSAVCQQASTRLIDQGLAACVVPFSQKHWGSV